MVSLYRPTFLGKVALPDDMAGILTILQSKLQLVVDENGVASMQPVQEVTCDSISLEEVFQATLLENLATPVVKVSLKKDVQKKFNGLVLLMLVQSVREGLATFFGKTHNIDHSVRESGKGGEVYTGYYFYLMGIDSGFEEFKEVLKASRKETVSKPAKPSTGWGALKTPATTTQG